MNENDEIIQEFLSESRDMIDEVEPFLIELQEISSATGAVDVDRINSIFRTFHSIKGSAGFLEFNVVNRLTHNAETLLDLFRKGKARLSTEHTDILCRSLDFLHEALKEITEKGTDQALGKEADAFLIWRPFADVSFLTQYGYFWPDSQAFSDDTRRYYFSFTFLFFF